MFREHGQLDALRRGDGGETPLNVAGISLQEILKAADVVFPGVVAGAQIGQLPLFRRRAQPAGLPAAVDEPAEDAQNEQEKNEARPEGEVPDLGLRLSRGPVLLPGLSLGILDDVLISVRSAFGSGGGIGMPARIRPGLSGVGARRGSRGPGVRLRVRPGGLTVGGERGHIGIVFCHGRSSRRGVAG